MSKGLGRSCSCFSRSPRSGLCRERALRTCKVAAWAWGASPVLESGLRGHRLIAGSQPVRPPGGGAASRTAPLARHRSPRSRGHRERGGAGPLSREGRGLKPKPSKTPEGGAGGAALATWHQTPGQGSPCARDSEPFPA